MKHDIEKIKKEIPDNFHWLLQGRLCDTDEITDKRRVRSTHKVSFNKCERCNYDLLKKSAYGEVYKGSELFPINGYVNYYDRHKLVLCDRCVDHLNGDTWEDDKFTRAGSFKKQF